MKFLLHNEQNIVFPPIRPAYQEGELLFGRFRMLIPRDAQDSILGEGGTGIIHLVRDELLDRVVALKLPHENILRDPTARFDVIRETRQAIELTHPHIVRIHDFHEGREGWGISMQHVRGMNLDEWRHVGRTGTRRTIVAYNVDRITGWIRQLCEALIYAHEDARMVHRDIKPKNLMLEAHEDGNEKLLLTDFGITQKLRMHTLLLSRAQPGEDSKGTMGTLPYMSWQQIQGAPASIFDDIYAVGATIYELLTGRPPFYEGSYAQIRAQVETVTPPSMAARLLDFDMPVHDIPEPWEEAVRACLAKNPEDRPQSIRELMAALELSGTASTASGDADLRGELLVISHALEERAHTVTSLQREVDQLRGDLEEARGHGAPPPADDGHAAALEGELDAIRASLAAIATERDALRDAVPAFENSLAGLQQRCAALEEENLRLQEGSTEELRQTGEAAEQQMEAIRGEAAEQLRLAGLAAQERLAAVEAEAAEKVRLLEDSARAQAEDSARELSRRLDLAEAAAQERITAAETAAREQAAAAEALARQRMAATEEHNRQARLELERLERSLRLKTARPLASALARLDLAEQAVKASNAAAAAPPPLAPADAE